VVEDLQFGDLGAKPGEITKVVVLVSAQLVYKVGDDLAFVVVRIQTC
jgi:hypothetical protein